MEKENGADPAFVSSASPPPSSQQAVSTEGFNPGERKPMKHGAPELAYIAQAAFRASFADDEDEQLVKQKWCEWEDDRAKAIRTAHFVIRALGGWGSVATAVSEADVLNDIGVMMSEFVDNWPQPKRLDTALALVAKTLRAAIAMEARRAETQSGSVHDSAAIAQNKSGPS